VTINDPYGPCCGPSLPDSTTGAITDMPTGPYECGTTSYLPYSTPPANTYCGGPRTVECTPHSLGAGQLVTIEDDHVTCVATDATGQTSPPCTLPIPGFQDTIAPSPSLADTPPFIHECGSIPSGPPPGATATDLCDGTGTPGSVTASFDPNANATGTYDWVFGDAAGNQASISRDVEVVDTTPPDSITITGSAPFELECGPSTTPPSATASDRCAGTLPAVAAGGNFDGQTPGQ